jgi:Fe/S biogenesis protein NfuA
MTVIEITEAAQDYFRKLISQQDDQDLGLRLRVLEPGTPRAACDLQFCPAGDQADDDRAEPQDGFTLYVAADSVRWLESAEIDFETAAGGGQLTIRAPKIKGDVPAEDAPLADRVRWVIEAEINPQLASHGGVVSLVDITETREVVLRFGGGCHGCGMADVTLKEGIEKTLRGHFPEIAAIRDATDHETGENPYFSRG